MQDPSRFPAPEAGLAYALQAAVAGAQRCSRPAHQLQVLRQTQLVPEAAELVEQPAVQVEHLAMDPEDPFAELHRGEEPPLPEIVGLGLHRDAAPASAAAPGVGNVLGNRGSERGIRIQENQDVAARLRRSPVLGRRGAALRFVDQAQARRSAGRSFPAAGHVRR